MCINFICRKPDGIDFGFGGYTVSTATTQPRHHGTKAAIHNTETHEDACVLILFMDTQISISYNLHVLQNVILLLKNFCIKKVKVIFRSWTIEK